jgi:hypothetical protein
VSASLPHVTLQSENIAIFDSLAPTRAGASKSSSAIDATPTITPSPGVGAESGMLLLLVVGFIADIFCQHNLAPHQELVIIWGRPYTQWKIAILSGLAAACVVLAFLTVRIYANSHYVVTNLVGTLAGTLYGILCT